jgi:hypothetical protein
MRSIASLVTLLVVVGCIHQTADLVDSGQQLPADAGFIDSGTPDSGVTPDSGLTDAGPDAGPDAGMDAGSDAGVDAGWDGGQDAGMDAGSDAGPDSGFPTKALFLPPATVTCGTTTWMLAAADMNHDGIEDLLNVGWTWTSATGTTPYYGTLDGGLSLGLFVPGNSPAQVATGDLNGDGWMDFATSGDLNSLDVEMNLRNGSFASTKVTAPTASEVHIADIDGDGRPDLVGCSSSGIYICFNDGAPSFEAAIGVIDDGGNVEYCGTLVVADLNADGNLDLADIGSGDLGEELFVRLGFGDGGFTSAASYPVSQGLQLMASDINGDGLPDLLWSNSAGIAVMLNQGAGAFGPELDMVTDPETTWSQVLTIADLNGDGFPDVATTGGPNCGDDAGGGAWVFLNDGDGGFISGTPLATDPTVIHYGITAWRPSGALLPSLVVGDFCDGNISIFANITLDGG